MSKADEFFYRRMPEHVRNDFLALKQDERELVAELYDISVRDPIVHNFLRLWLNKEMSLEKMLLSLVLFQSKHKTQLEDTLVKVHQTSIKPRPIILKGYDYVE